MASEEQASLNAPHKPTARAVEAFTILLPKIKEEIVKSRRDWDKHEPRMWSRANGLTDHQLVGNINVATDLVLVRAGEVSYGAIILGKLRIATNDEEEGFVHLRIHDPPNRGDQDVMFHSLWTDEGNRDADGRPMTWNAIQRRETELIWFNE